MTQVRAAAQLQRVLDLLAGSGLSSDDVDELFAPEVSGAPVAFADLLNRELGVADPTPLSLVTKGEHDVVAVVRLQNGAPQRFTVRTDSEPPHRFIAFDVGAAPHADALRMPWAELLANEPAAASQSELDGELAVRLDGLVAAHRRSHRTPGLIAAVADEQARLLWCRAEGVASLSSLRAPSPTTALRIGSIAKTMTALLVLQLVERGLVGLDAPAADHLTSVRLTGRYARDVTVRHLLTHTSGLRPRSGVDVGVDEDGQVPGLAEFYAGGLDCALEPGREWSYSNDAFALLGQLVEDVVGRPLPEHAAASLFDPLGMTATSYRRDTRIASPLFEGIDLELDEVVQAPYRHVIPEGAGSVFSTVEDMARYGASVHALGADVLGAAAFAELVQPQDVPAPGPGLRMGLGWVIGSAGGAPMYWHNGGWPGASSELAVLPEQARTVLVFANTLGDGLDALCFALAAELAG